MCGRSQTEWSHGSASCSGPDSTVRAGVTMPVYSVMHLPVLVRCIATGARRSALLAIASSLAIQSASAQTRALGTSGAAHARLVGIPVSVSRSRLELLVTLTLDPGWHISWRNPGETGLPTVLTWTLPEGTRLVEERWPVPLVKHTSVGATHTMEGTVPWLVTLATDRRAHGRAAAATPPASPTAAPPAVVRRFIRLTMRYGVCREICIPAQLSIDVPVPVAGATPVHPVPAAMRDRLVDLGPAIPARRLSATSLCIARMPASSRASWELVADTGRYMDAAMPLRPRRGLAFVATVPAEARLTGRPRMLFVQGARAFEAPLDFAASARGCTTR